MSILGHLAEVFADDWHAHARKEQLPPPGDWNIWLMCSGRGFGKTRSGSEWVKSSHCERPRQACGACGCDGGGCSRYDDRGTFWLIVGLQGLGQA